MSLQRSLHVERVHVDRQGYTRQGRYFGRGEPLFLVWSDELKDYYGRPIHEHVRASSAGEARVKVAREKGLMRHTAASHGYATIYDSVERLRRVVGKIGPRDHGAAAKARRALGAARKLAARVKARNAGDVSFRWVDTDLDRAETHLSSYGGYGGPDRTSLEHALSFIRKALDSLAGAASRAPKRDRRRRSSRRDCYGLHFHSRDRRRRVRRRGRRR